ncbi:sugar phosphate isomerase/epimerase family protein [Tunicatimonas pelagia]|uniref:sugar phosphate isomerase/epimerase family protein n=1 Tax=Tunicatimonas pelagia TaxID=931531 RepID=UPI0026660BDD|nr:sugar phosphate isomerase/epimerase [Tunicatimonas pelagia]WKN41675.1 sugar phosphate isomerase/epimerase [Tunicatimonas pelagia]
MNLTIEKTLYYTTLFISYIEKILSCYINIYNLTMMKRRNFLKTTAAASVSIPFLSSAALTINNPYVAQMGVQLYTVRDQMENDPVATLKAIKEAGYAQIEGGDVRAYQELTPIMQDLGLTSSSTFFPWSFITGRWDLVEQEKPKNYSFEKMVDDAVKYNFKYLVFGYMVEGERETLDDYRKVAEQLNRAGELCQKAGIDLCYHNHAFEFEPMEGQVPFRILMEEFEPSTVFFELDVFWASLAGHDPIGLMKEMPKRIKLLHLKDKKPNTPTMFDHNQVPHDTFQELGDGVVEITKIMQLAKEIGVEQCFVEQDQSPNPVASINQSMSYLRSNL